MHTQFIRCWAVVSLFNTVQVLSPADITFSLQTMKVGDSFFHITLLLAVMIGNCDVTRLPESFLRCRRDDPDLNSCLQAAIQKAILLMNNGVPELQMLPVDPLEVTNINIQDGVGRPVKMNLDLINAKLHGVTQCHIKSVRADLEKRCIEFDANVPFTTIDADYIMDGKFLVLPLKGKGKCSMNLTDYDIFVKIRAEPLVKDETVYWDIKEFYLHIDTLKLFQVNFENLFNGDKELGDNTNKVLNENWKEFFEELRPILRDTFGGVFLQYTNQLFHKVPESGLFLES